MLHWLSTAPHPDPRRWHTHGADQGQRGWRLHAVEAEPNAPADSIKHTRAACGVKPAHGWDIDLFIEKRCARCAKKVS